MDRHGYFEIVGRRKSSQTHSAWSPFPVSFSTLLLILWVSSRDWPGRSFHLDPAGGGAGKYFVCAALLYVVRVPLLQCRAEVAGDTGMGRDHFHSRATV